jgi:hypothetical protein
MHIMSYQACAAAFSLSCDHENIRKLGAAGACEAIASAIEAFGWKSAGLAEHVRHLMPSDFTLFESV